MRFKITANFQDTNQPSVSENADSGQDAVQVAHSLRNRFAALKSLHVDDAQKRVRDLYAPTPAGLMYLFTVPMNLNEKVQIKAN
jgi:hypothetical protein